jgi:flagellar basal body-associated protein FliL
MRWLLIVLLVSICALILASAGVAWHIWRQHAKSRRNASGGDPSDAVIHEESDIETEEVP